MPLTYFQLLETQLKNMIPITPLNWLFKIIDKLRKAKNESYKRASDLIR